MYFSIYFKLNEPNPFFMKKRNRASFLRRKVLPVEQNAPTVIVKEGPSDWVSALSNINPPKRVKPKIPIESIEKGDGTFGDDEDSLFGGTVEQVP